MPPKDIVRIAAIGDLHYGKATPAGSLLPLFGQISESADILALAGDLTDYGLAEEARAFVKELSAVKIPIVGVLGNHDVESNQQTEILAILKDAGVTMLDGETTEIHGIGFAGIKGFTSQSKPAAVSFSWSSAGYDCDGDRPRPADRLSPRTTTFGRELCSGCGDAGAGA